MTGQPLCGKQAEGRQATKALQACRLMSASQSALRASRSCLSLACRSAARLPQVARFFSNDDLILDGAEALAEFHASH